MLRLRVAIDPWHRYTLRMERQLFASPWLRAVLCNSKMVRDDIKARFGLPDERWGQRVCAAVVGSATPEAVQAHARIRLAAYKCPKQVFVLTALPHTATGKIRRLDLADQCAQARSDW